MSKWLKVSLGVLTAGLLGAGAANAGLNPSAVAKLYWQTGTNGGAQAARDNTAALPQMVVTVKGLVNFRGADVQLLVNALDKLGLPGAWQAQSGGCAEGGFGFFVGGRGGTVFRNVFTVSGVAGDTAVSGVVPSQNGINFNTGDCRTPHGVGLLWLSAAGADGHNRQVAREYAVWAISMDLNAVDPADGVTPCEGAVADPLGPRGVCVNPNFKIPCNGPQLGAALQILDGNLDTDAANFAQGFQFLTWNAGSRGDGAECPTATPVRSTTWGTLKKIYK